MNNTQIRKNVESAIKSLELEGFVYTSDEKAIFEKIASGEISLDKGKEIFMKKLSQKYGIHF